MNKTNIELLEKLDQLDKNIKDYQVMLTTARDGINATNAEIKAVRKELTGTFKGRSNYSHSQAVEARRSIVSLLSTGGKATGEITQALPNIDAYLINRELKILMDKKAVAWNGKMGVASKYYRAVA